MTRAERIRKLVGAIKQYRGAYVEGTGRWLVKPNVAARARVVHWLTELRIPATPETMAAIDGFQNHPQMHEWIERQ